MMIEIRAIDADGHIEEAHIDWKERLPRKYHAMAPERRPRENKAQVVPILKRFLRLEDEDLIARIYEYHRRAETTDGRIDAALVVETIRDARQAEGVSREVPVGQVFDFSFLEVPR